MNRNLLVAFFLFFTVCLCFGDVTLHGVNVIVTEDEDSMIEDNMIEDSMIEDSMIEDDTTEAKTMQMSVRRIAKMYECTYPQVEMLANDERILAYGEKSWSFPFQNVNLSLSYPSKEYMDSSVPDEEHYWITRFKVLLYVDGNDVEGHIVSGGVTENKLTLSFYVRNISTLTYRFWVHGVEQTSHVSRVVGDLCS